MKKITVLAVGLIAADASAAIRAIGPFAAQRVDTFDSQPFVPSAQSLVVLDGVSTVRNLTTGGAIKTEFSSSFNGDLVKPLSGIMIGQIGVSEWTFTSGQRRFGGMFENNSGVDGGTIEFYDAFGTLLGTQQLDCPAKPDGWRWNGWESDAAFTRIKIIGNGIFNGFLWFENVQISSVPGPSVMSLLAAAAALGGRRRRAGTIGA